MSNAVAAATGDRRKALERLRDTLAADLDVAEPNVRAQLAAQYRATLADLAAIPDESVVNKRDELAERRKNRQSAAKAEPASRSS